MQDYFRHIFAIGLGATLAVCFAVPAHADPVTDFIVGADAAFQNEGEESLNAFVASHPLLVGASVAQLLDVAIDVAAAGDATAAEENVAFAEQVARIHGTLSGETVPLELVDDYRARDAAAWAEYRRAEQLEAQAVELRAAGDPGAGIVRLKEALEIYAAIGASHEEAVTWGTLGVFEWARGDMQAVRAAYEKAIVARRAVQDHILQGRTLNGLGSASLQLGEYETAISFYEQAREKRRATGDLGGLGTTLTYLGNVHYVLGQLVPARKYFEEALPILETLGQGAKLSELHTSIGNLHSSMGRYDEAARSYAQVIEYAQANDAPEDETIARVNLADNLRLQGRFGDAIAELEGAQALIDETEDPALRIILHRTRGVTFSMMGDLDRAREDLSRALSLARDGERKDFELEALINLGELYRTVLAKDKALEMAEQAIGLAAEQGAPRRYRDANALAGDASAELGDLEKARSHWAEALAQDQADGAEALIPLSEIGLANVEALAGEDEAARERYRRARILLEDTGQYVMDWLPLLGIAHSFEASAPDSAAHFYDLALSALEAKRVSDAAIGTGFVRRDRAVAYEGIVHYYAQNSLKGNADPWQSRAFAVAERVKARGLLDLVQKAASTVDIPGMEALLDSLYSLPTGRAERQTRFRLEEQMATLRAQHAQRSVGDETVEPASPLSLRDVMDRMPKKTLLLEFSLGDSASYLWAVDRKKSELVELPPREELAGRVERLRASIEARGNADEVLRQEARSLYRALLEPISSRIEKSKTLVIVPDGVLFELPFEALLTEDAEGEWKDMPFLGRERATVYAPSATVWLGLRDRESQKNTATDLLAAGDPTYAADTGLAALPFSRTEVETIGALVKKGRARLLLGAEASETQLKAALSEQPPRVLHLAAHGLIDAAEPSRSSIALAAAPESGDDGFLYSLEIFSLPLDGSLVVLSACESARGRVQRGEGVIGLTRAFLGAGSSGVVASLWPVSDESTSALMQSFYREMLKSKRPAPEALKRARRKMLERAELAHPFHWAAFVSVGSDRSPW